MGNGKGKGEGEDIQTVAEQQSSTAAAAATILLPLLRCSPAAHPSCQCCCYVFEEAVVGWVWVA
jgi:hypothetical protein